MPNIGAHAARLAWTKAIGTVRTGGQPLREASVVTTRPPLGLMALSGFFWFGALMAGTTCVALLFPANQWAVIWRLNPEAHTAFQAMGSWAIVLMSCIATACAVSATGLWTQARWGHRLAIAILVVNMVGDVGNAIVRTDLRPLIGIPIAAAMIGYLLTPGIRKTFARLAH